MYDSPSLPFLGLVQDVEKAVFVLTGSEVIRKGMLVAAVAACSGLMMVVRVGKGIDRLIK